ncbi:MAG: hypothetical protein GX442_14485 [Candidatus Riflebacteria bacterium]|nr:hypothetical protein [Candidatus Riflebacteria bacterium]
MALIKANRCWNYKTYDLATLAGPDFLERLGALLDEAGKNGWELAHMTDRFMILKQLFQYDDEPR